MIIISAMSENRVIGIGNVMPWSVPAEYAQYLDFVDGETVVMGRRTFETFGADLPKGTTAVVVSRGKSVSGVETVSSLDAAISFAKETEKQIFIAGGGTIYEQAIPLVDEMFLSTIKGEFEGDVFFPEFNLSEWEVLEERDEKDFVFRRYRRLHSVESR